MITAKDCTTRYLQVQRYMSSSTERRRRTSNGSRGRACRVPIAPWLRGFRGGRCGRRESWTVAAHPGIAANMSRAHRPRRCRLPVPRVPHYAFSLMPCPNMNGLNTGLLDATGTLSRPPERATPGLFGGPVRSALGWFGGGRTTGRLPGRAARDRAAFGALGASARPRRS